MKSLFSSSLPRLGSAPRKQEAASPLFSSLCSGLRGGLRKGGRPCDPPAPRARGAFLRRCARGGLSGGPKGPPDHNRLPPDCEGAAAVEFVVAMVPLFLSFFAFMQVGKIYTANLVFQHAATVAARSAAVIVEPGVNPGDNGSESDVKTVARMALGMWQTAIFNVKVEVKSDASATNPKGMVTAKLTGDLSCRVAMGATVVCGLDRMVPLHATARFPLQGARYKMSQDSKQKSPVGELPGAPAKTVCDPGSSFDVCSK